MTPPKITIRKSTPEDALAVVQLKDETWLATYPSEAHGITEAEIRAHFAIDPAEARIERWRGYLTGTDASQTWVAMAGDEIIGFVSASRSELRNEIKAAYMLPNYQRQGVGSRLIRTALEWLGGGRDVFLEVVEYNHPAIAAYEKYGFERTGHVSEKPFTFPSGAGMPVIQMSRKAQA